MRYKGNRKARPKVLTSCSLGNTAIGKDINMHNIVFDILKANSRDKLEGSQGVFMNRHIGNDIVKDDLGRHKIRNIQMKVDETFPGHEHRNRIQRIMNSGGIGRGDLTRTDKIDIEEARGCARQRQMTVRVEMANITSSGWPVSI